MAISQKKQLHAQAIANTVQEKIAERMSGGGSAAMEGEPINRRGKAGANMEEGQRASIPAHLTKRVANSILGEVADETDSEVRDLAQRAAIMPRVTMPQQGIVPLNEEAAATTEASEASEATEASSTSAAEALAWSAEQMS
jgi:hypothetical protein